MELPLSSILFLVLNILGFDVMGVFQLHLSGETQTSREMDFFGQSTGEQDRFLISRLSGFHSSALLYYIDINH